MVQLPSLKNGDLIEIGLGKRSIDIVGVHGEKKQTGEIAGILGQRKVKWQKPKPKYATGILSSCTQLAVSAMRGAYMGELTRI